MGVLTIDPRKIYYWEACEIFFYIIYVLIALFIPLTGRPKSKLVSVFFTEYSFSMQISANWLEHEDKNNENEFVGSSIERSVMPWHSARWFIIDWTMIAQFAFSFCLIIATGVEIGIDAMMLMSTVYFIHFCWILKLTKGKYDSIKREQI